jgi:transcriptional antiterminator RfaH
VPLASSSPDHPSYWCCAQHETNRQHLAVHTLGLNHYETYIPRIRTQRTTATRKTLEVPAPLFPGYLFIKIVEGRWWDARWSVGVCRIILDGNRPAVVPDAVIDGIRAREVDGLIQLAPPPPEFSRGDRLRILQGAFAGQIVLFEGMTSRQRVEVLLILLGSPRRVTLPRADVRLETLRPSREARTNP